MGFSLIKGLLYFRVHLFFVSYLIASEQNITDLLEKGFVFEENVIFLINVEIELSMQ